MVDFSPHRPHLAAMHTDLDLIFAALADPTRRAMLSALLTGERSVSALAEPLPMSLAAVSKHLHILARAGLISQERAGREKTCRLEPDGLAAGFIWMQGFGAFAAQDYDALERYLAATLGNGFDDALGGGEVD